MRSKVVAYLFWLIIPSILIISCQNRPREVLNRKRMEQLMYDVYVAEAVMENDYRNFDSPEKKEAYINKVFAAHEVTQAQWDTSLSWYSDRIDLYLRMNDSVKARLKRAQTEVDAKIAQQNVQRIQSDEVIYSASSYIPPVYVFLMPGVERDGFRFSLDSAKIVSEISEDNFSFTFSIIGIPPSFNANFLSLLTLAYGDTTIYRPQKIRENGIYSTPVLKYIAGDTLSQISGFIHLHNLDGAIPNIQLYDISLGSKTSLSADSDTSRIQPVMQSR